MQEYITQYMQELSKYLVHRCKHTQNLAFALGTQGWNFDLTRIILRKREISY